MKKILAIVGIIICFDSAIILSQPIADFAFSFSNNGCTPDSVVFINLSTGAQKYRWNFGDLSSTDTTESPMHIYYNPGVFIVYLVGYDTLSGDSNEMVKTVPVTNTPIAGGWAFIIPDPFEPVCPNAKVRFYGPEQMDPYPEEVLWYLGDGDSSALFNPVHFYKSSGNYTVRLVTSNRCGVDSVEYLYIVDSAAKPQADFSFKSPVCHGEPVQFSNITFPYSVSNKWNFGDTGTISSENPVHFFEDTGSFIISLIAFNECSSDTIKKTIKVESGFIPVFTKSVTPNPGCPADTIIFDCQGDDLNSLNWSFGDSTFSVQQNISHLYKDTGIYEVILKAGNSCGNVKADTFIVTVKDSLKPASVNFSWLPLNPCPGSQVSFTYSGSDTTEVIWYFGDGDSSIFSTAKNIYSDTADYTVKLYAKSRCGGTDSISKTISVKKDVIPFVSFSYLPGNLLCMGDTLQFINFSQDYDSVLWDFGDGVQSIQKEPWHVYNDTGEYFVLLKVSNKCGGVFYFADRIKVFDKEMPSQPSIDVMPLAGCTGDKFNFSISAAFNGSVRWFFGDGDTSFSNSPVHTYSNSGEYAVTMVINNNCGTDTVYKNVSVRDGISAEFTMAKICDTIIFTDISSGAVKQYAWDFGDGDTATAKAPSHFYKAAGNYFISLTVYGNGCKSTKTGTVNITPKTLPVAVFSHKDSLLTVSFSDSSLNADTWFWQFGDGDSSIVKNPVHVYPDKGSYYVCLTVTNGCESNAVCDSVKVIQTYISEFYNGIYNITLFPNPAKDEIFIIFMAERGFPVIAEILNILGVKIDEHHFAGEAGMNVLRLNCENINAGIYSIRFVIDDMHILNERMVIIK